MSPGCPFCNCQEKKVESFWVRKPAPRRLYKVTCWQCGGSSGVGDSPEEALMNWTSRPTSGYHPLGEHSYLLPGGQKYQHLLVHDRGNISLIDYVDEHIAAQIDLDLGEFRISKWIRGKKDA